MASSPFTSAADAVIVGLGARSAAGLTALQVTMSARARALALRASHLIDRHGDEIATVRLSTIGDNVFGIDRLLALAAPALTQAAFPWRAREQASGAARAAIPLVVALPCDERSGFDSRIRRHFLPALAARARVDVDIDRSHLVFACRGGGVEAFRWALAELARERFEVVIVGGVDSYFDSMLLEQLDRERRLDGPETENGMLPGEGAAFVALASRRSARGLELHGRVLSAVVEHEPRPYGADEPCLGLGITLAVRRAVEAAALHELRISWTLTDVANERHRVDEWAYALARNHLVFTPELEHDQPLLMTGDVGAASAAMLTAMAAVRWDVGCAVSDVALVATHSDGPERGAMVIASEEQR